MEATKQVKRPRLSDCNEASAARSAAAEAPEAKRNKIANTLAPPPAAAPAAALAANGVPAKRPREIQDTPAADPKRVKQEDPKVDQA